MGLLDSLTTALAQAAKGAAPALVAAALTETNLGLQGIVTQLQKNGYAAQVASWLGNGANLQITPDQLRAALGNEHVRQIAAKMGVPADQALALLAQHLPDAVDQASPDGTLKK